VDGYAKQLGIDVAKLHQDMASQATTDRIDRDKKLADSVGVQGTPTIFINGREYDMHQDLDEWIALEVQAAGGDVGAAAPAPAPGPAASAASASKKK
jgi:protein-disulfide isomerase